MGENFFELSYLSEESKWRAQTNRYGDLLVWAHYLLSLLRFDCSNFFPQWSPMQNLRKSLHLFRHFCSVTSMWIRSIVRGQIMLLPLAFIAIVVIIMKYHTGVHYSSRHSHSLDVVSMLWLVVPVPGDHVTCGLVSMTHQSHILVITHCVHSQLWGWCNSDISW